MLLFSGETSQPTVFKARGEPTNSGTATPDMSARLGRRVLRDPSGLVKDGINMLASGSDLQAEEVGKMGSVLPTMWMGTQSGRYRNVHHHSSSSWSLYLNIGGILAT